MELKFQPEPMGRMTSEVKLYPKSITPARWRVNGELAVGFSLTAETKQTGVFRESIREYDKLVSYIFKHQAGVSSIYLLMYISMHFGFNRKRVTWRLNR